VSLTDFRSELGGLVTSFLWRQWAQLGVSGAREGHDAWSQDPEVLLSATLELARGEPRLFDEVADWLALNHSRLSMQRFRNALAAGAGGNEAISAGLCSALSREAPGFRWGLPRSKAAATREPLFDGTTGAWSGAVDEAFLRAGLVRGPLRLSGRSRPPVLTAPICLAFRLRELLGVTARAEVVRVLLLHPDRELGTAQVTSACLYAKRNVAQALASLAAAGAVAQRTRGRADLWAIDRPRWLSFLGVRASAAPRWVDWPPLLRALLVLTRWLQGRDWQQVTPYLQASEAREIAGIVGAELSAALPEWQVPDSRRLTGEAYLERFTDNVRRALRFLAGDSGGRAGRSGSHAGPGVA